MSSRRDILFAGRGAGAGDPKKSYRCGAWRLIRHVGHKRVSPQSGQRLAAFEHSIIRSRLRSSGRVLDTEPSRQSVAPFCHLCLHFTPLSWKPLQETHYGHDETSNLLCRCEYRSWTQMDFALMRSEDYPKERSNHEFTHSRTKQSMVPAGLQSLYSWQVSTDFLHSVSKSLKAFSDTRRACPSPPQQSPSVQVQVCDRKFRRARTTATVMDLTWESAP